MHARAFDAGIEHLGAVSGALPPNVLALPVPRLVPAPCLAQSLSVSQFWIGEHGSEWDWNHFG